jgi:hypothetical protein
LEKDEAMENSLATVAEKITTHVRHQSDGLPPKN